jgi:hypothetical protein
MRMMSIVELNASNPGIKRGILSYSDFLVTHPPVFAMRPTPWRQTTDSAQQSLSLGYFTV